MKEQQNIPFLDYARVVACLMVMFVHASENFYGADPAVGMAGNVSMLANESNRFWVAFYDGGLSRTAVPIFFMVSAFLLVPMRQGQTMTAFYKRRFMRILPPFFSFLLLYSVLPLLWGGMTWHQSLMDLNILPFNFPSMAGHLWFMYPLISLYIIIPLVSPWLQQASARDELTFLGFFAFSTLIPWFHRFVSPELWGECFWNQFSAFWYCSGYLGYLVLAHYIRVHLQWSRSRRLCLGTLFFVVGAAFTAWSFWWKGVPGQLIETPMLEWSWEFCTPNVLCAAFGAFMLFTCIAPSRPASGHKAAGSAFVSQLSPLTYGMYLMHMFFLAPIAAFVVHGDAATPLLPVWVAIPAIALLTFVCSAVTTKLLSFMPGSRYVVGV